MAVKFRPAIEKMTGYVPGEQPRSVTRLVKLNTNENPYPPSPRVAEAVRAELDAGEAAGERLRLYSDPRATALVDAAAEVYGLPADHILAGNGSDELLALLARAFAGEEDAIAYPYPTYLLYETMGEIQGCRRLTFDFDADFALPAGLTGNPARLTFVANPNSPSGTRHDTEALRALARSLAGVLVVDEAYADFADASALPLVGTEPNVVVLRTLSKSYSLAGMRVGLLLAAPAIVAGLSKVKDSYSLDRLAIVAGAAAMRDQDHMRAGVARVRATRARLIEALRAMDLAPLPSESNFVFVRMGDRDRAQAAYQALRTAGILVRYFDARLLDDGLRITVGTDTEIDALLAALSAHLGR